MKETLPKNINILSTNYNIVYHKNRFDVSHDGQQLLDGQIDYIKREIRIFNDDNCQFGETMKLIIHEVLHGIFNELNILQVLESEFEEQIVDQISSVLCDTLIRNDLINCKSE